MAPGLFASLFSVTSPSSNAATLKADSSKSHAGDRDAPMDVDAMSDETVEHSPPISDHDAITLQPTSSTTASEPANRHVVSLKEAQDVADVDMQLSSPPSSPPTTAPPTPNNPPPPIAAPTSIKMEPSSSDPGKRSASDKGAPAGRTDSASTPAAQRTSRRRMMPARLSQVSSLLAGSMLEEELLMLDPSSPSSSSFPNESAKASSTGRHASESASHKSAPPTSAFTLSSIVVLTSDTQLVNRAVFPYAPSSSLDPSADVQIKAEKDDSSLSSSTMLAVSNDHGKAGSLTPRHSQLAASSQSSLVSTLAIKRQQLIETPDFKPRDDTLYMPKTRGLRSEAAEDTSDAAYERRHRKSETAEKRQRKAEVHRLSRDRQKLLARIEQLKTVEARMLQPIVIARDQVRAEAAANNQDQPVPKPEAKPLQERIEGVRKELLADAYDTLKRYDLLLSTSSDAKSSSPGPSALPSKGESAADKALASEDASTRSQSPRLKIRIKGGRATWESADSASPTSKASSADNGRSDNSRRVSARQPKHRVESLPTPLTGAAVEAVEDSRRKRQRLSGTQTEEHLAKSRGTAAHTRRSPGKTRGDDATSPERRICKRDSPEVGGTYKGKSAHARKTSVADQAEEASAARRPQRAAAAAAAAASARQRQYAERSFSDFDYEDEDEEEEEEAESALDIADGPQHLHSGPSHSTRRANLSLRRSPVKLRDHRSSSTSSTTSSISSMASSIGYMYPTVNDTGSLKVSQSLAEIQAASNPLEEPVDAADGARKKLRVVLSRSPSVAGMDRESKKAIAEAIGSDTEEDEAKREKGRALTESEAESILAAFLGTTPLGKAKPAPVVESKPSPPKPAASPAAPASAPSSAPAPAPAPAQNSTLSKRRSTRRDTTQSFGEKLPELLTKTAPFDYSVMGYFRSIDKPGAAKEEEEE